MKIAFKSVDPNKNHELKLKLSNNQSILASSVDRELTRELIRVGDTLYNLEFQFI